MRDEEEHREQKAEVADAVDDESFLTGVGGAVAREVKADQQVAREAHTFPADKEQQEVGTEHQDQHEKHEEVEVGEEAPEALLMCHVADGVDMDQEADARDDRQHDEREVIDDEGKRHVEARNGNPVPGGDGERERGLRTAEKRPKVADDAGR